MTVLQYLEKHLPEEKALKVLSYINDRNCGLKITRPRKTKRGDFRQRGNSLSISVNHDENSYRFLYTLVHEIAHLKTFLEYENKVLPHGLEWKRNFKELFYHLEMDKEFARNAELFTAIKKDLENPKASSGVSINLERALAESDSKEVVYLENIPVNQRFKFKGVVYQKLEKRRTRALCLNIGNGKKYTINQAAIVEIQP